MQRANYLTNFIHQFIKFTVPQSESKLIITKNNHQEIWKKISGKEYDYIILLDVLEQERDIQKFLEKVYSHLALNGRLVVIYKNYLHSFIAEIFASIIGRSKKNLNWLSTSDIKTFLKLTDFDLVVQQPLCFISLNIPLVSNLLNRFLIYFFPFNHLSFLQYIIARKVKNIPEDRSVSLIIPARNEAGNIENLFKQLPVLGTQCEIIFVEGHSNDDTKNEIKRCMAKYKNLLPFTFILIDQKEGIGKADAVRRGFNKAKNDILLIYDADMSVKASDLTKFYLALINRKGDFINGSRLVYPLEGQAMQFLNILGNKFFSLLYSWLLAQPIKDTLCGTKALWRKDYQKMQRFEKLADSIDPFGDFYLLFNARRLNLKIIDIPVRYYERTYGATNIKRFKNAWELAKFSLLAIKKLKMRY